MSLSRGKQRRGRAVLGEIAIPEKNVKSLRGMLRQIDELSAQVRGAVNALAVANDVPANWQFDADRMVFVEPPAVGREDNPDAQP